jgi:hypothetical protein
MVTLSLDWWGSYTDENREDRRGECIKRLWETFSQTEAGWGLGLATHISVNFEQSQNIEQDGRKAE